VYVSHVEACLAVQCGVSLQAARINIPVFGLSIVTCSRFKNRSHTVMAVWYMYMYMEDHKFQNESLLLCEHERNVRSSSGLELG
jgi:hypothetical protein